MEHIGSGAPWPVNLLSGFLVLSVAVYMIYISIQASIRVGKSPKQFIVLIGFLFGLFELVISFGLFYQVFKYFS